MGAHISDGDIRIVLDSIRRIVRALRLFDREAERHAGLSGAQLFVLQNLAANRPMQSRGNGISVNELAERTHTDQSSVSVVIEKLVRLGLVRRERSERDARSVELSLTAKGEKVLEQTPGAAQERMIAALKGFSRQRREMLGELLVELIRAMGIEGEAATLFFEEGQVRIDTARQDCGRSNKGGAVGRKSK
jgi:DNA-binding MarR family transcriptional regulator